MTAVVVAIDVDGVLLASTPFVEDEFIADYCADSVKMWDLFLYPAGFFTATNLCVFLPLFSHRASFKQRDQIDVTLASEINFISLVREMNPFDTILEDIAAYWPPQ